MNTKHILKIRMLCGPKLMIEFIVIFFCLMGTLQLFGVPHIIEYFLDAANICLALYLLSRSKIKKLIKEPVVGLQCLMIFFGLCGAVVHFVSPALIIWAVRNLFRFVIFFAGCACYLNENDYDRIVSKLNYLFYFNVLMILYEYFVLGFTDDAIGGIFGATQSVNGDLNVFLVVMTIYYVVKWEKGQITIVKLGSMLGIDVIVSVIAELKFFFIEMALIIALVFLINRVVIPQKKISFKWIGIVLIVVVMLVLGVRYLGQLYSQWQGFFSLEKIWGEATREGGYTNRGDINRLTFFGTINDYIFNDSHIDKIMGIGLGGAEFSGRNSMLTSQLYQKYFYLHYFYFSLPWMYIECGLIGLLLYIMSFLMNFKKGLSSLKQQRKNKVVDDGYVLSGTVCSLMAILLLIYNQSMRLPSAYLVYFGMAMICIKTQKREI